MEKILLIDGNSLVYRAYFALREADMRNSTGQATGAVHGFSTMLINLIKDQEPQGVAVAFDLPTPTFRHERIPTYKAGREKAPDDLYEQLALVKEILPPLGIQVVEKEGYEADDVLATLASQSRDDFTQVVVVTGDRDSYQLVEDPYIQVLYNRRGVSDYVLYDENGIWERTGVYPKDYVLYAALRGDKSDNLPGVPGVGEKTAAKLVNAHGTIDGIFESLEEQKPKLRDNLEQNESTVRLNVEVMELIRDVKLPVTIKDLALGPINQAEVNQFFESLELRTVFSRLSEVFDIDSNESGSLKLLPNLDIDVAISAEEIVETLKKIDNEEVLISGIWDSGESSHSFDGICIVKDLEAGKVLAIPRKFFTQQELCSTLQDFFDNGKSVIGHNVKRVIREMVD